MSLTTDPSDPRLTHGTNDAPATQAEVYLVDDGAGDFVRPVRQTYVHDSVECGAATTMGLALAETYARNPRFYGATYCVGCMKHRPVAEFAWAEPRRDTPLGLTDRVGS